MPVTAPEWLTKRGGTLAPNSDGYGWVVLLDGQPQYVLTPRPAGGKFTYEVMQTVNGRRLESGATHPSVDEALRGGLEDLRQALGW
jgi:hypothetical protein